MKFCLLKNSGTVLILIIAADCRLGDTAKISDEVYSDVQKQNLFPRLYPSRFSPLFA